MEENSKIPRSLWNVMQLKSNQERNVRGALVKSMWCILEPTLGLALSSTTHSIFVISETEKVDSIFKLFFLWYLNLRYHLRIILNSSSSIYISCIKIPDVLKVVIFLLLLYWQFCRWPVSKLQKRKKQDLNYLIRKLFMSELIWRNA